MIERTGELRLYPEAVLGIFPQAGSYLGPDYEQLILQNDFVIENNPQYHVSAHTKPKEATTFTVFEQDASQEEALRRIKMGESLVVQEPPGTGKSQLIANLMSDFSARGKRVLLVCQSEWPWMLFMNAYIKWVWIPLWRWCMISKTTVPSYIGN
ncbi:MAG: hypothetical protein R2822_11855 [Spirosomataceae bacterium]